MVKNKLSFFKVGYEIDLNLINKPVNTKTTVLLTAYKRLTFLKYIFMSLFFVLVFRIFDIALLKNDFKASDGIYENRIRKYQRADIVDRNGNILATNLPAVNLAVRPKEILYPKKTAQGLSKIFPGLKYEKLLKILKSDKNFYYIKKNIQPKDREKVLYLGEPGLIFEEREFRVYPYENLFVHAIGNVNSENIGIEGIERTYNNYLKDYPEEELKLSLDKNLQTFVHQKLTKAMKVFNAKEAAAVIMDVNDGEILSLVSLPDYNPKLFGKGVLDIQKRNHATYDVYELGSVFKPFNIAAAIESGMIKDPYNVYYDVSKPLKLKGFRITDVGKDRDIIKAAEVLIYSSNIGSAKMALDLGPKYQRYFLNKFNFWDKVNINFSEIQRPIIPRVITPTVNATLAYGYGISVSPLHVITAFNALVNGGIYYNPTLVHLGNKPKIGNRVIYEKTSKILRELLRMVVVKGSARRANLKGIMLGGKTGSAQKLVDGKYEDKKLITSFVGAFPIDNPKYSIYVMINEPKPSDEYGRCVLSSCNVVPIAREIVDSIIPILNVGYMPQEIIDEYDRKILEKLDTNFNNH